MFRDLTRNAAFHLDYLVLQLQSQILCHWLQRNTVTGQSNVCVLFWGLYSPMHAIVVLLTEGTVQIDFQESLVANYCLLSHSHQTSLLICRHVNYQGSTRKRCNDCPTHELQLLLYVSCAWTLKNIMQNSVPILIICAVCWTWNMVDLARKAKR
jgi:hypothetical protein